MSLWWPPVRAALPGVRTLTRDSVSIPGSCSVAPRRSHRTDVRANDTERRSCIVLLNNSTSQCLRGIKHPDTPCPSCRVRWRHPVRGSGLWTESSPRRGRGRGRGRGRASWTWSGTCGGGRWGGGSSGWTTTPTSSLWIRTNITAFTLRLESSARLASHRRVLETRIKASQVWIWDLTRSWALRCFRILTLLRLRTQALVLPLVRRQTLTRLGLTKSREGHPYLHLLQSAWGKYQSSFISFARTGCLSGILS